MKKKDIDFVAGNSKSSSGAPISDVSRPPAKEAIPPPAPFTPVKEGKKYYRLLLPILGAVVAGIIVLVLVSSSMQHPSGPPLSIRPVPSAKPTNPPPIIQTTNKYSFLTKWGSSGTGDGQFSNPLNGVAVDPSSGNVYVADAGNDRIQVFAPSSFMPARTNNSTS